MPKPYKVGLTGGIGSGKSQVAGLFSKLGIAVIDADTIARELTVPGSPINKQIIDLFDNDIIDTSGSLDRKKLREHIFSDYEARKKLESILHPHVFDVINRKISDITSTYCILSIPLLLETGSQHMVDTVLVVDCPVSLQIERVTKRDGLSVEDVNKIIGTQISRTDRLNAANEVIKNEEDIYSLSDKVTELHLEYLKRAHQHKI